MNSAGSRTSINTGIDGSEDELNTIAKKTEEFEENKTQELEDD